MPRHFLQWETSSQVYSYKFLSICLISSYLFSFFLSFAALIKFIRPVFVSRSDPDSRRKTVEEIKRRACSAGQWPQVRHTLIQSWLGSWLGNHSRAWESRLQYIYITVHFNTFLLVCVYIRLSISLPVYLFFSLIVCVFFSLCLSGYMYYNCLSVCLLSCLIIWLPVCLSVLNTSDCLCVCVYLSNSLSVFLSISLPIYFSFCLSVCLLTCLYM